MVRYLRFFVLIMFVVACDSTDAFSYIRDPTYSKGGAGTTSNRGALLVRFERNSCSTCVLGVSAEVSFDGSVVTLWDNNQSYLFQDISPGSYDLHVRFRNSDPGVGWGLNYNSNQGLTPYATSYYMYNNTKTATRSISIKNGETATVVVTNN